LHQLIRRSITRNLSSGRLQPTKGTLFHREIGYICVVAGLSWPSHMAITVVSTPDCSICIAVVCRIVCGEVERRASCGQLLEAVATARARRRVMLERVSFPPSRFGNSLAERRRTRSGLCEDRLPYAAPRAAHRGELHIILNFT
jgi:hypothetical protein